MPTSPLTFMIDHVGLCVRNIEAATAFLEAAIGAEVSGEVLSFGDAPQAGFAAEQHSGSQKTR